MSTENNESPYISAISIRMSMLVSIFDKGILGTPLSQIFLLKKKRIKENGGFSL